MKGGYGRSLRRRGEIKAGEEEEASGGQVNTGFPYERARDGSALGLVLGTGVRLRELRWVCFEFWFWCGVAVAVVAGKDRGRGPPSPSAALAMLIAFIRNISCIDR